MLDQVGFDKDNGRALFIGPQLLVKGAMESAWPISAVVGHAYGDPAAALRMFDRFGGTIDVQSVLAPSRLVGALRAASDQNKEAVLGLIGRSSLRSTAEALERVLDAGWKAEAGAVLIVLDDAEPGRFGVDPRAVMEQLQLPLLEPARPQEVKDWLEHAITLSRIAQGPSALYLNRWLIHGGGTVAVRPNRGSLAASISARRGEASVKVDVGEGLGNPRERILMAARELSISKLWNRLPRGEVSPIGFVTCGQGAAALTHALTELDLVGAFPLLIMGQTAPIDAGLIRAIGGCSQRIIVVEAGRGWLEREVHQALSGMTDAPSVYGKRLPDDQPGVPVRPTLHPSDLIERLAPVLIESSPQGADWVQTRIFGLLQRARRAERLQEFLPERTPTFPPASLHRDTASLLADLYDDLADPAYMSNEHNHSAMDLRVYHDTDASRHIRQAPFDRLESRPIEAFSLSADRDEEDASHHLLLINDETLAGYGRSLVAQAFEIAEHVTFVVTPRLDGFGPEPDLKRMVKQLRSLIPFTRRTNCRVDRVDPLDRVRYRQLMERTVLAGGVAVLVLDGAANDGVLIDPTDDSTPRLNVATAVDEFDPQIVRRAACPTLRVLETPDGPRYQTDRAMPLKDATYRRLNISPAFEKVSVVRARRVPLPVERLDLEDIPQPDKPIHATSQRFHAHIAGIVGRGVEDLTALLLAAGETMGYDVEFLQESSDAAYSAGAWAAVVFTRPVGDRPGAMNRAEARTTAASPRGSVDLLLGCDLLEAARSVVGGPAVSDRSRTAAVVNLESAATMRQLLGDAPVDSGKLTLLLAGCAHADRFSAFNASKTGFRLFKTSVFLPAIILGMAYQRGLVPLTFEAIEQAADRVWPDRARYARMALKVGRVAAVDQQRLEGFNPKIESPERQLLRCQRLLALRAKPRVVRAYVSVTRPALEALALAGLPRQSQRRFVRRVADCFVWGGASYGQLYAKRVMAAFEHDKQAFGYTATLTLIDALAKAMLVKDEVYTASLLIHPAKRLEDRRRFDVSSARGDRLAYEHEARPTFTLLGRVVQFEWKAKDWQLHLISRCRWLRRVVPGWHRRDIRFRDWYLKRLDEANWWDHPERYSAWQQIISAPLSVTGFRTARWPLITAAKQEAEELIAQFSEVGEHE